VATDAAQAGVVGIGLIGCGKIGEKRILALPSSCSFVAAHDIQHDVARRFVDSHGGHLCDSSDELIRRSDVDAVIIATTHDQLAHMSILAIKHGKHVFVEKPGGRTTNEIRGILTAATRQGVQVSVGFNHRFHPAIMAAKSLIDSGEYGRLLWVRGRYGHGGRLGYEREWRANKHISGGGELLDQGCHLIDLATHFFGSLRLDYSRLTTSYWPMEVEDNAFLALTTDGDATIWLHVSWTEWKNTFSFEITLEHAKIEVTGLGGSYGTETLIVHKMKSAMGPPDTQRSVYEGVDESWGLEFTDFLQRIAGVGTRGASLESTIDVHEIIAGAYER